MVETSVLVIGAVIFFAILVAILRSAASGDNRKPIKKKQQQQKPIQKQKQKKGRLSLKKSERKEEPSEWVQQDTAKETEEVLEFLKGKDPVEIAKQHAAANKQAAKKRGKAKVEVQESDESAGESVASDEGFEEVKKTAPKKKPKNKKKEKAEEQQKDKAKKPYFKPLRPEDGGPAVEEPRRGRRERKGSSGAEEGAERKPRPEGQQQEKRERKPRPEGERREKKPRPEGEEKLVRRPITSAPNVKYEQADLNDILNSITQDFKKHPVPAHPPRSNTRKISLFSKIPRHLILKILGNLEARDLVALAAVNKFFLAVSRNDSLWRELLIKDLGQKDVTKNCKGAYKTEYQKRKNPRKDDVPQGDEKDSKAKGPKSTAKESKKEPKKEESAKQE